MKKTRLFAFFLSLFALLSLLGLPVWASEAETASASSTEAPWADDLTGYRENLLADAPDYEAGCETALLLELNSGIVVYAKNAESTVYPASLTKIMTCMVAIEYAGKDLDKMVTVSEEALEGIAEAGGDVRLQVGEQLSLRDLLYYLMVNSTNEAGNVIAEYVAGDIPAFVSLMNKTAKDLGCTGTHFANTHGLHDPNHYTTARDLSVIVRKALTYELFREICNTPEYTVPATNLSKEKKLTTTNYLILNDGNRYLADNGNYYTYYRSDAAGIKTGYTSAAGRCVISRASDGNMDLLCIIMGAQTRMMSDGSVRYDNFVEAKKLFNYGFDNFAYAKMAIAGSSPMFQENVKYAENKRGVVLIPSGDVSCLLPKEYDKEQVSTRYELDDPNGLSAPLSQGQKVGKLYVSYGGTVVGTTELETLTAVEEKPVDKAIADLTGKDVPDEEKSLFQKLLGYWYVPVLVILGLILILMLRNAVYRAQRRKAMERRRQRANARDAREARRLRQEQQTLRSSAPAGTRTPSRAGGERGPAQRRQQSRPVPEEPTRRLPGYGQNPTDRNDRGGRR
ncbi:MAG: serine hydrolase [Oscillospiraceae bacterium]|nr:serine hydrolase [Oscillospiraceae bacterium]